MANNIYVLFPLVIIIIILNKFDLIVKEFNFLHKVGKHVISAKLYKLDVRSDDITLSRIPRSCYVVLTAKKINFWGFKVIYN